MRLGELRGSAPRQYLLRFAFGAGVSVAATLITAALGYRIGGAFLAFPAILPASLTWIEREHGRRQAAAEAKGAQLGALGLIAFGLIAGAMLPRLVPSAALMLATTGWSVVAIGAYIALRTVAPHRWGHNEP
jgi:hypothetical protein